MTTSTGPELGQTAVAPERLPPAPVAVDPVVPDRVPLGSTVHGDPLPTAAQRSHRRSLEDPFFGWTASIGVFLLSLFLRLWNLGDPKSFAFDETYYAKDAWSMLNNGYVRAYVDGADKQILAGHTQGLWEKNPSMIVHPEVGKWLIAIGEKLFGMDPFGWRVASAVVGSLMILIMVRLARRLTGSTLLGVVAGLLLSFDGLQLVLSRLALLDIFVAFFVLAGVHCVVADRDWFRARLAARYLTGNRTWLFLGRLLQRFASLSRFGQRVASVSRFCRRLGERRIGKPKRTWTRPWLWLAGVSFGLGCGTKWEAAYALAAFGLLVLAWSAGARRMHGQRRPWLWALVRDGLPAFAYLVVVAFVVYVLSWTGWLIHNHAYQENFANTQYTHFDSFQGCMGPKNETPRMTYDNSRHWSTMGQPQKHGLGAVEQALTNLAWYHHDVYNFHTAFLNCSHHTYQSMPSGWLFLNRPVGVDAQLNIKPGDQGCDAAPGSDCLRQVLLLGNPMIWWFGCLALAYSLVMWIGARDWRHGLVIVGLAATWWPWTQYDMRPIFIFYAVTILPFVVLSLTLALGALIGRDRAPSGRRTFGVAVAGAYFILVLLNFAWFWPIWTDSLITHQAWLDRIWFSRWI